MIIFPKTGWNIESISEDHVSPKTARPVVACNQVGKWLLIVGPHSVRQLMMKVIAGLAEKEPVRVVDAGAFVTSKQLDYLEIAQHLRGKPGALERIEIGKPSSPHQVLMLLERTPCSAIPFVVLDLLNTFYETSVKFGERKRLLRGCLENLNRMEKYAGGVVSVTPPKVRSKETVELFKMVEAVASDTYRVEVVVAGLDHLDTSDRLREMWDNLSPSGTSASKRWRISSTRAT